MNIKHTASAEAVRLSIQWMDNMAKSKHNSSQGRKASSWTMAASNCKSDYFCVFIYLMHGLGASLVRTPTPCLVTKIFTHFLRKF